MPVYIAKIDVMVTGMTPDQAANRLYAALNDFYAWQYSHCPDTGDEYPMREATEEEIALQHPVSIYGPTL